MVLVLILNCFGFGKQDKINLSKIVYGHYKGGGIKLTVEVFSNRFASRERETSIRNLQTGFYKADYGSLNRARTR